MLPKSKNKSISFKEYQALSEDPRGTAMSPEDGVLQEFNKRYAIMRTATTYILIQKTEASSRKSFFSFHENDFFLTSDGKLKNKGIFWLKHFQRRTYENIVFNPTRPSDCESSYNIFRGVAVPSMRGRLDFFWQQVQEVICFGQNVYHVYAGKWMLKMDKRRIKLMTAQSRVSGLRSSVLKVNKKIDFIALFGIGWILNFRCKWKTNKVIHLTVFFLMLIRGASCANEIDYKDCQSIVDVIERESLEIRNVGALDHNELAQLHVSRGESYLLNAQHEKAAEDFLLADFHSEYMQEMEDIIMIRFRTAFGKAVSYDNLGMRGETEEALQQLQIIAEHVVCPNCAENKPRFEMSSLSNSGYYFQKTAGVNNNGKDYNDILGPDTPPSLGWCEEVVTGVGRAMDAIACLAPSYGVKIALIGVIEALITRGVKCCQTGGFWKACAAPVVRKWKEWKDNKEKNALPSARNLPLYTN
ncbi:MAG: hypothetical protein V4489_07640 [Chlamydiota bacterium]